MEQRYVHDRKNLVRLAWGGMGVVVDSRHIVAAGEAAGSTVLVEEVAGNRRSCREEGLGEDSSLLAAAGGSTVVAEDTVAEEDRILDRGYSPDIPTFLP